MTVFEELVDELKIDNLIDESAPERRASHSNAEKYAAVDADELARQKQKAEEEFSNVQLLQSLFDGLEGDTLRSESSDVSLAEARTVLGRIRQFSDVSAADLSDARAALKKALAALKREIEHRDARIEVSRLRLYCERSHPPLSAKSLIALAGLYRTAAFSEEIGDKFDFVMTRLFTVESNEVRREMRFGRGEAIEQIAALYEKWSVPAGPKLERIEITDAVDKFAAFGGRIDAAGSFVDLLRSDLPATVREYKRSLVEKIFEPEILASVMECNVRVGARFVEIAAFEKQAYGPEAVRSKYGDGFDEAATAAAVRTLKLSDLLESADLKPEEHSLPIEINVEAAAPTKHEAARKSGFLGGVNKLLLAATVLTVIAGVAAFFLIEPDVFEQRGNIPIAKPTNIDSTSFAKYFANARTTSSTFYLITKPEWNGLTPEEKKKVLKSVLEDGKKRNMRDVSIMDENGKRLAYASDNRLELTD